MRNSANRLFASSKTKEVQYIKAAGYQDVPLSGKAGYRVIK